MMKNHFQIDVLVKPYFISSKKGFTLVENGKQDFNVLIPRDLIPLDSLYKFHPWWLPCGTTSVDIFEDNSLVIDNTDKGNSLA